MSSSTPTTDVQEEDELRSKVTETIRQVAWMWEPTARDLPESCVKDVDYVMSLLNTELDKQREAWRAEVINDLYSKVPDDIRKDLDYWVGQAERNQATLKEKT